MSPRDLFRPDGAARLGQLLGRATPGRERARLPAEARRAFEDALRGGARRRARWIAGTWALAGVAALALLLVTARRPHPITVVKTGISDVPSGAGALEAAVGREGELDFSDGSTARLTSGTRARLRGADERGVRLELLQGELSLHVRHREATRWSVTAGDFEIVVTGTAFDVRWTDDQRLRVRLREGAVIVRGALAGAGLTVRAGQTFTARLRDGDIHLGATEAGGDTAADAEADMKGVGARPLGGEALAPAPAGPPGPPAPPAPPAQNEGAASPAAADAPPFVAAKVAAPVSAPVAASNVARAARSSLAAPSLESCLAHCDADGLDDLARAARRRGQPEVARRALTVLRERHPGSELAHEAAFLLGRLAEERNELAEAVRLFELYASEAPTGQFRSYALGRRMVLVERLQGPRAARALAEEYLALYATGPHATHARLLLGEP